MQWVKERIKLITFFNKIVHFRSVHEHISDTGNNRSKCRVCLPELPPLWQQFDKYSPAWGHFFEDGELYIRWLIAIQCPDISYRASSSHRDISSSCYSFERRKCYRYHSCRGDFCRETDIETLATEDIRPLARDWVDVTP